MSDIERLKQELEEIRKELAMQIKGSVRIRLCIGKKAKRSSKFCEQQEEEKDQLQTDALP